MTSFYGTVDDIRVKNRGYCFVELNLVSSAKN